MKISSMLCRGLAMALFVACSTTDNLEADTEKTPARATQAISESSFHYLRCNATGWGVDDRTRLVPTGQDGVLELSFQVTQSWLVDEFDDCVLTETPVRNGWGSWQQHRVAAEGSQEAPLAVHLVDLTEPTETFKISYPGPGHYRAVVQLAEGSLAITKAPPVAPGEARWAGIANLTRDAAGRLYRASYWPPASLSRVDGATGHAIWTRAQPENVSFELACSDLDYVLVREGGLVSLLDPATGTPRWSTDLGGELARPDVYPFVRCQPNDEHILLTYRQKHVAAVRRTDGAHLWTFDSPGAYPNVAAWVEGTAVIETYGASPRFSALDLATGAVRWTLDEGSSGYLSAVPEAGLLFFTSESLVRRLDPVSGRELWRIATDSEWPWLSFAAGFTVLHDAPRIVVLNEDGSERWSVSGPQGSYPEISPLPDGTLLHFVSDYSTGRTDIARLGRDGSTVWTRTYTDTNAWPQVDPRGDLFVHQGNRLSLLDLSDGSTRWTFEHVPEVAHEGPGGRGSLGSVVASDERSVHVMTYGPGYRYPPMTLWSLDASSGAARWTHKSRGPLQLVASDSELVHVSVFPSGHTLALEK